MQISSNTELAWTQCSDSSLADGSSELCSKCWGESGVKTISKNRQDITFPPEATLSKRAQLERAIIVHVKVKSHCVSISLWQKKKKGNDTFKGEPRAPRTSCFQEDIGFSLEVNTGFSFKCSRHTSAEEAVPWPCSLEAILVLLSLLLTTHLRGNISQPEFHLPRSAALASEAHTSKPVKHGSGKSWTELKWHTPANGYLHQQCSEPVWTSLNRCSEMGGLLSAPLLLEEGNA